MKNLMWIAAGVAVLTFSLVAGASPRRIDVHGHRGARAKLPENTLPGFAHALRAGADYLELDLAVTRDDHLVVSHDLHTNATICLAKGGLPITQPRLIHEMTLTEVKGFDCGTLKNPRFPKQVPVPGTPMPTLDEVFAFVKNSRLPAAGRVHFNIETKIKPEHPDHTVSAEKFARLVVASLRKHGMVKRTVLQSFDYRTLREARKLEPKLRISALSETPEEDLGATARALKPDFISPDWKMLTPAKVEAIHRAGAKLAPWTVNLPADWDKVIALGADAIITDDPAGLIEHLKKISPQ